LRRILAIFMVTFAVFSAGLAASGQQAAKKAPPAAATFAPVEQWKAAVLAGDAAKLGALYSANPAARVILTSGETNAQADVVFWTGLKARSLKLDIAQSVPTETGLQQVVFQAEISSPTQNKGQTVYVLSGQLWQKQGEQWRIVATRRGDTTKLLQPMTTDKELYVPGLNAHEEIAHALKLAGQKHRRVLIVFGANWCYDCHVLDLAFQRPDVAAVLTPNYEVVHVDVGEGNKNQDIMKEYQVPMARGIPAVAVLDANGKLVFSQKDGEFEKARSMGPDELVAFLNKWKASS
jgi:hypothetical protein